MLQRTSTSRMSMDVSCTVLVVKYYCRVFMKWTKFVSEQVQTSREEQRQSKEDLESFKKKYDGKCRNNLIEITISFYL